MDIQEKKKFRFSRVPFFSLMLVEFKKIKLKSIHMIFIHFRNGKNIYIIDHVFLSTSKDPNPKQLLALDSL